MNKSGPKRKRGVIAEIYRVDTREAILAIIKETGLGLRGTARLLGAGHSTLCRCLKKRGVSLEALALYSNILYEKTGMKLVFTVTPDLRMYFTLDDGDPKIVEAVLVEE